MKFVVYLMWATLNTGEAHNERDFDNMSECLRAARQMNRAEVVYIKTHPPTKPRKWFCITTMPVKGKDI
ncbi:MAG: hypothetical protein HOB79_17595 [Rhodospirillaceae bacterium]|jgi:hypothetical protein|nr:hypothetical protein [Rhodospirillaceae bacterium]